MQSISLPLMLAITGFVLGWAFALVGINVLAGLGWALVAASLPCFMITWILFRGIARG
jgi:hypothetical protein